MRDRIAIKNSSIVMVCQVVEILLGFLIRKLFIQKIGIELLGVNGTFASLLTTLALADLGFESAVIFSLYKPIQESDTGKISSILLILKRVYNSVGLFIFVAGICVSFFLPSLLKGVDINLTIYLAFYINLIGSAVTYFLAYKRTYLLALQKDYVRNIVSLITKVIAVVIQLIFIYLTSSYLIYCLISVFQNLATNIGIARYVDRYAPVKFDNKQIDRRLLSILLKDVKDIFFGKIAGYIYSSTDNLILSATVSTVSVGFLGNYTQILYQMRVILNNTLNSTKPIIGHFLTEEKNRTHSFNILLDYTFIRFVISDALFVPGFVLCNGFIEWWIGPEYVLPSIVSLLLCTDIFITCVHGSLVDYIQGLGYFKQDRNVSIIGALINIVLSLVLVNSIGIVGVLIGTVVSQVFFWFTRSRILFRDYFNESQSRKTKRLYRLYWLKCIEYVFTFYLSCFLSRAIFSFLPIQNLLIKLIIGGIITILIVAALIFLFFRGSAQFKYVKKIVAKLLEMVFGLFRRKNTNKKIC